MAKFKDTKIHLEIEEFDVDFFTKHLLEFGQSADEEMQLMLNEALKYAVNKIDYYYIYLWLMEPEHWLMPMVSMDTFMRNPYFIGQQLPVIYDGVDEFCKTIVEGGYTEGIELAGIGSGKSFGSQILICYQAHRLLCMKQPHVSYGIGPDKPLTIVNMGLTATQAIEVVFAGVKKFIDGSDGEKASPFFAQFNPIIQAAIIKFPKQNIVLSSGNSKVETILGYNIHTAVLDEAAFYLDNDDRNIAQEIYTALGRRITSRLGKGVGLAVAISSPRYEGDFITQKMAESQEVNTDGTKTYPHIFGIQMPTWKAKGPGRCEEEMFYFSPRKAEIIENTNLDELISAGEKVNTAYQEGGLTPEYSVWQIPVDFLSDFQQDPEKAKRDFGATPSSSIAGYFTNLQKVTNAFNHERADPVISPGKYDFGHRPLRIPYFIGIDIGFNKDGKGDHCGFCMGHGSWEKYTSDDGAEEFRMNFHIDLMERIGMSEDTGEVDLALVRQRIYDLKSLGFSIKLVSFDQYASKDFRQIIEKKGFKTEYISVDRTTESYDIVKQAIYEDRINMYHNATVERELKQLEVVKGTKIDHPPKSQGGSKDVSDALAQVCTAITLHTPRGGMGMRNVSMDESQTETLQSKQHRIHKARERHAEKVMEQVRKQEEARERIERIELNIKQKQSENYFL